MCCCSSDRVVKPRRAVAPNQAAQTVPEGAIDLSPGEQQRSTPLTKLLLVPFTTARISEQRSMDIPPHQETRPKAFYWPGNQPGNKGPSPRTDATRGTRQRALGTVNNYAPGKGLTGHYPHPIHRAPTPRTPLVLVSRNQ